MSGLPRIFLICLPATLGRQYTAHLISWELAPLATSTLSVLCDLRILTRSTAAGLDFQQTNTVESVDLSRPARFRHPRDSNHRLQGHQLTMVRDKL